MRAELEQRLYASHPRLLDELRHVYPVGSPHKGIDPFARSIATRYDYDTKASYDVAMRFVLRQQSAAYGVAAGLAKT